MQSEFRTITKTINGTTGSAGYSVELTEGTGLCITCQFEAYAGYLVVTFDTSVDVSKYDYLIFTMKHTQNGQVNSYLPKVDVGLSDDKTSISYVDYIEVTDVSIGATEYKFDISKITGTKYIKIVLTRY